MALREPALASVLHDSDPVSVGAGVLSLLAEPTVVVVEDVHWVDEATVDLLLYLGRRLARCRAVLVLTHRPVEVDTQGQAARLLGVLARAPEAISIPLDPLSPDAVARLAEGTGLDPTTLHARTGGNPFYVTEVLADPARAVPGTVSDAVRARVADLPVEGRELLDLVSLAPAGLELAVATAILGADPAHTALDQVGARGMATLDTGRIVFRHDLARVAVAEAVPPGRRHQLHARLLEVLDAMPGVDPARLVHHAELADDRARLLTHAPVAARAAEMRDAHRAAAAHLERSIAVADGLPAGEVARLWTRLASAVEQFEDGDRVLEVKREAVARCHAAGDVEAEVHAWCGLADAYLMQNAGAAADEAIARATAILPEGARGSAWLDLRRTQLMRSRQPARAQLPLWEQLVSDAREVGSARLVFETSMNLARADAQLGDVSRALRLADACADLARQDLPRTTGLAECNIGEALGQSRHHREAERLLETAIRLCDDRDSHHTVGYATALLARVHLERGDWGRARELAESVTEPVAEVTRGLVLAVTGRLDVHETATTADLATAWQVVADSGTLDFLWPVAVALAEAAWVPGEPAAAADAVLAALEVARAAEHPWAVGELTWWARQAGHDVPLEIEVAEPWTAALAGDWAAAADAWAVLGCPLDEAIVLSTGDLPAQRRALDRFIQLGAAADADRLRQQLRAAGEVDLPARERPRSVPDSITARQLEVLGLVADGLTNAAIAERLFISEKTVGHHVSAILTRLDARSRTHAVAVARGRGLLSDPPPPTA